MIRFFRILVLAIFCGLSANGADDLIPAAITVYRNPEFFRKLNESQNQFKQPSSKLSEAETGEYKYPGETKKPNPPASTGFEISYDNSPEFHHEPRDIFVHTTYKPYKKKGPYSPKYSSEEISKETNKKPTKGKESGEDESPKSSSKHTSKSSSSSKKPNKGTDSGEEENSKSSSSKESSKKPTKGKDSEEDYSKESKENFDSGEEPRRFVSVFNESPEEEFGSYHKPILLARPGFDHSESSELGNSAHKKPYQYNKTRPVTYEDWKRQTYPTIHARKHLNHDSRIYSEEPSSNFFEETPSYYTHHGGDSGNFFEYEKLKHPGADTKHIYRKLLNPKKSVLFKFHSKPKFKKFTFKLRKKHLHNTDWFDEYPFNF